MMHSNMPPLNDALGDLREFVRQAQAAEEFHIVSGADQDLEIGAIYELSQEQKFPPALMFENIRGCDPRFRILCNVRNTHFVVGDLDLETLKEYRRRPREQKTPIPPRVVSSGPVLDNVLTGDQINVLSFPAPKWHAADGGRYIGTECLVITKDPDSDWVNIGTYRVMVADARTLTVPIEPASRGDVIQRKYWERGLPCPMAISVGQAPILGTLAGTAVRAGESEYAVAGGRIGRPIDVVSAASRVPIPADAERSSKVTPAPEVEPGRRSVRRVARLLRVGRPQPVVRVEAVYHRDDAIIIGQPPTKPELSGPSGEDRESRRHVGRLEAAPA